MRFFSIHLPVVSFTIIHQTMISATVALVDFERVYYSSRTSTTTTLSDTILRYDYSLILHKSVTVHRNAVGKNKWSMLPILSIRGGNNDRLLHMSASSSSSPLIAPIFDMERMKIRLDGLSQYAVICALLLNVCLNIYFNTMKYLEHNNNSTIQNEIRSNKATSMTQYFSQFHDHGMKVVKLIFILSSIFSIISSAYTAVVFTLLGLYSKAALGMGCDTNFLLFFDTTHKLRESAFDAFVISLVNFELSFLSSLIIAYKGQFRLFIIAITALCLSYSFYHWVSIISIAGRLLYSTSIPTNAV